MPEPAEAGLTAVGPGIVLDDQDEGESRVYYRPQGGGRSSSRVDGKGIWAVKLTGPLAAGRGGEPRALKTLFYALRDNGHHIYPRPQAEAEDARGEDARIDLDGRLAVVQVVSLPADAELWRDVSQGGADCSGGAEDAAALVRGSIEKKSLLDPATRGHTLLAIDASKFGALCSRSVVDAYLAKHGDPAAEFGFLAVWIVGPTAGRTLPLRPSGP